MTKRSLALSMMAVAMAVAAGCGGGKKPSTTPSGTVRSSETATPTVPAEPSASATGTHSPVVATPLTMGMQAVLGYDTVLYYTVGCYACGGGSTPHLYRVYMAPDGRERTDDLFIPLAKDGGLPQSFTADWAKGELWSAWCRTGYCGLESDPSADAVEVLYHSRDGGVSWEEAGRLEPGSSLIAPVDGELLTSVWKASSYTYRLVPSGREPARPSGPAESYATDVAGQGVVWQQIEPGGAQLVTFFDVSGALLFRAPGKSARYVEKTPQGNLVQWRGGADESETRNGILDDSGRVIRSWSWAQGQRGDNLVQVGGQLSENRLYATVMTPEWFEFGTDSPGITQEQLRHGRMFPIEVAIINLDTATIHPLAGPSFNLTGNQNPYVSHIDTVPVRRVKTGGDCLNVRTDPTGAARSLGCFKDGVLLRLVVAPKDQPVVVDGTTWIPVILPSDLVAGWAAAEFLER